jgi:hypothetical protein
VVCAGWAAAEEVPGDGLPGGAGQGQRHALPGGPVQAQSEPTRQARPSEGLYALPELFGIVKPPVWCNPPLSAQFPVLTALSPAVGSAPLVVWEASLARLVHTPTYVVGVLFPVRRRTPRALPKTWLHLSQIAQGVAGYVADKGSVRQLLPYTMHAVKQGFQVST